MSIAIIETDHDTILVGAKELFLDGEKRWVCRNELSTQEQLAFDNYIKAKASSKGQQVNEWVKS